MAAGEPRWAHPHRVNVGPCVILALNDFTVQGRPHSKQESSFGKTNRPAVRLAHRARSLPVAPSPLVVNLRGSICRWPSSSFHPSRRMLPYFIDQPRQPKLAGLNLVAARQAKFFRWNPVPRHDPAPQSKVLCTMYPPSEPLRLYTAFSRVAAPFLKISEHPLTIHRFPCPQRARAFMPNKGHLTKPLRGGYNSTCTLVLVRPGLSSSARGLRRPRRLPSDSNSI